jgi:hypothetical protein
MADSLKSVAREIEKYMLSLVGVGQEWHLRCGHTERYAMFTTYATYSVYAMFTTPRGHTESYVWYETAQS